MTGEWDDTANCNRITVSYDGRWVAVTNIYREVYIFNPEEMREPRYLTTERNLDNFRFAKRGHSLITLSAYDGSALWSASTRTEIWRAPILGLSLWHIDQYDDSSPLYLSRSGFLFRVDLQRPDSIVRIWDGDDLDGSIRDMSLSADGKSIGLVTSDGEFVVWDIERSSYRKIAPRRPLDPTSFSWAKEGTKAFQWGFTSTGFDVVDLARDTVYSPIDKLKSLPFHIDVADSVFAVSYMQGIDIRRASESGEGELIRRVSLGLVDYCRRIKLSPDGRTLIGACKKSVRRWNIEEDVVDTLAFFPDQTVSRVAWHPDGQSFAAVTSFEMVRFDFQGRRFNDFYEDQSGVGPIVFSPDGSQLYGASVYGAIRIWDAGTGVLVDSLDRPFTPDDRAYDLRVSRDGSLVTAAYSNGSMVLWDAETRQVVAKQDFGGIELELRTVDFAFDQRHILLSGNVLVDDDGVPIPRSGLVKVWSIPEKRFVHTYRTLGGEAGFVRSSSTSNFFIHASEEGVSGYHYHSRWTIGVPDQLSEAAPSELLTLTCVGEPCRLTIPFSEEITATRLNLLLTDAQGRTVLREQRNAYGGQLALTIPPLPTGHYFLRYWSSELQEEASRSVRVIVE